MKHVRFGLLLLVGIALSIVVTAQVPPTALPLGPPATITPNGLTPNPVNISSLGFINGTTLTDVAGAGILNMTSSAGGTTFSRLNFGTASSSNPAIKVVTNTLQFRLADDSGFAGFQSGPFTSNGTIFITGTGAGFGLGNLGITNNTPTISSGFGSSPSVASSNGNVTFRVNVGTGGVASSGIVAMQATSTTGWNCQVSDLTSVDTTRETASTASTVTVTAAAAWTSADILIFNCWAF